MIPKETILSASEMVAGTPRRQGLAESQPERESTALGGSRRRRRRIRHRHHRIKPELLLPSKKNRSFPASPPPDEDGITPPIDLFQGREYGMWMAEFGEGHGDGDAARREGIAGRGGIGDGE